MDQDKIKVVKEFFKSLSLRNENPGASFWVCPEIGNSNQIAVFYRFNGFSSWIPYNSTSYGQWQAFAQDPTAIDALFHLLQGKSERVKKEAYHNMSNSTLLNTYTLD